MEYRDENGARIQIGQRLGRGGEGTAYLVANRPNLAVKLYDLENSFVTEELVAKLDALISLANGDVRRLSAWPQAKVLDLAGRVCGFTMLAVRDHRPFHDVLTPKSRKLHFPEADWRFLIHTARNLARAFGAVHATGAVLADVNAQNLLVSPEATVKIIDCDSFQISAANRVFRCTVRTDDYTPPELQDADFRAAVRSQNHDAFGLAVLIFQLLMMGRHPYGGRSMRATDGLISTAIREDRFAYGPGAAARGMAAPDGTLPVEALGLKIWGLFETAFAPTKSADWRPRAKDWLAALGELENQLKTCSHRAEHAYLRTIVQCPWCAIAGGGHGGTAVFFLPRPVPAPPQFNSAACLAAARALPALEDVTEVFHIPQRPSEPKQHLLVRLFPAWPAAYHAVLVVAAFAIGTMIAGGPMWWLLFLALAVAAGRWGLALSGARIQQRREGAYAEICKPIEEIEALHALWISPLSDRRASEMLGKLENAHGLLLDLPGYRFGLLTRLAERDRSRHLQRYLEAHPIVPGVALGVGDSRAATLVTCGVKSAADVNSARLYRIPGFGPALSGNLMAWRHRVESQFVLDPVKVLSSHEIAMIDSTVERERAAAEALLREGAKVRGSLLQDARRERSDSRSALVAALDRFHGR